MHTQKRKGRVRMEIENAYKLKIGRKRTQITTYENLQLATSEPIKPETPKKIKKQVPKLPSEESAFAGYNYYKRMKKRREVIKELAYNNFDVPNVVMITLTFSGGYEELAVANHEFNLFTKRLNSHYAGLKYIATYSRQSNLNWHYHVLCNFDKRIKNETIGAIWKKGMTYITYINTNDEFKNTIEYIIANLNECKEEKRGKRGYLASKNLERDIEVTSWRSEDEQQFNEIFPTIEATPRKILYSTKQHLGIQGRMVNEETGEVAKVTIPKREINPLLEDAGYESWDTTYTHLSSSARFTDKFAPLQPATPQPKKFKRLQL